jgi:hypothetical protein
MLCCVRIRCLNCIMICISVPFTRLKFPCAVARLGQQLDGTCIARDAAQAEAASASSAAVHAFIVKRALEIDLYVQHPVLI